MNKTNYRPVTVENTPNIYNRKTTPCKCPCCGVDHTLSLFWIGDLPARKFCPSCEHKTAWISSTYNGGGGSRQHGVGGDLD